MRLPTRVRLGIANQRIVARTLELPVMPSAEALDAQVRTVAPDHIPMPIDEAVLDFRPLGEVETAAGPRMRVVVVAVRREMVERLHAACDAAGLQVEGIDLAAFGMLRALPRPTGRDALRRRRRPGERRRRERVAAASSRERPPAASKRSPPR